MSNAKFAILVALVLIVGAGIMVAIIESNREPTPEEAARRAIATVGAVMDATDAALLEVAHNEILLIELGLKRYEVDHGWTYPPSLPELAKARDVEGAPYFVGELQDPWGSAYRWVRSGQDAGDYTIESDGPDRRTRTRDEIRWHPAKGFLGEG